MGKFIRVSLRLEVDIKTMYVWLLNDVKLKGLLFYFFLLKFAYADEFERVK